MRLVGIATVLGVLSLTSISHAESPASATALPVGIASFPAQVAPGAVAPSAATTPATPALAPPAADDFSMTCAEEPRTTFQLAAAALASLIRDGSGLLGLLQFTDGSSDTRRIDDAADREVRRLAFMRHLEEMRQAKDEQEFADRLESSLRKRAFLQNLEASRSVGPSR